MSDMSGKWALAALRNKLVALADRFMPRSMHRTILRKVCRAR
jgi:hypothetical protein